MIFTMAGLKTTKIPIIFYKEIEGVMNYTMFLEAYNGF
jgi:hypothetical protein